MVALFGRLLKILPFFGAVLVIAAIGVSIYREQMDQFAIALTALGFIFFLAMFLKIETASLRYYLNLSVMSILMLVVLALIYLFAQDHAVRWDFTRGSRYSLSPQTREVLKNLRKKVNLEVIATSNEPFASYLNQYTRLSDKVSFRIRNPYKEAIRATAPGEEIKVNDILITCGDKKKQISIAASADIDQISRKLESELVNGILTVIQDRKTTLYFVVRHGEKEPEESSSEAGAKRSIYKFAKLLREQGMDERLLDLQSERSVPDNCDMLAIVGPLVDFNDMEIEAVRKYLNRGGNLLVMLDPPLSPKMSLPKLRTLLAEYGAVVSENFVVDNGNYASDQSVFVPVISKYNPLHPITENLKGTMEDMQISLACPITKNEKTPQDVSVDILVQTSPKSWNISLEEYERVSKSGGITPPTGDRWAPQPIVVAVGPKDKRPWPRMVVFGDSDLISDAQIATPQLTLAYFSVNWLTRQGNLIQVPAQSIEQTPLVLSIQQRNLVSILSVVVIPFTIFFGGLAYTTMRRRKR